jgi:hypothetical protein
MTEDDRDLMTARTGSARPAIRLTVAAVIASLVALLLALTGASPAAAASDRHITPTGAGNQSGVDLSNAAPISQLNRLVKEVGAGGRVTIHCGTYSVLSEVVVTAGGTAAAPVVVEGEACPSGSIEYPLITGNAAYLGRPDPAGAGYTIFRLNPGANHLTFRQLRFSNAPTVFRATNAPLTGVTVEQMWGDRVGYVFFNGSDSTGAPHDHLRFNNLVFTNLTKSGIRLASTTNTVVIENVSFTGHGGGPLQSTGHIGAGVDIRARAHDIVIRNSRFTNFRERTPCISANYCNGDGIIGERDTANIVLDHVYVGGNRDAGLDLKSLNVRMRNVVADGNLTRGFRFWRGGQVCESGCVINHASSEALWYRGPQGGGPDTDIVLTDSIVCKKGGKVVGYDGKGAGRFVFRSTLVRYTVTLGSARTQGSDVAQVASLPSSCADATSVRYGGNVARQFRHTSFAIALGESAVSDRVPGTAPPSPRPRPADTTDPVPAVEPTTTTVPSPESDGTTTTSTIPTDPAGA